MSGGLTWHQPLLSIFDPTEPRTMPQDRAALFTVNWLSRARRLNRQQAFALDELETVLRLMAGHPDRYISQCMFDRPFRQAAFVNYSTHAFADLDFYRSQASAALTPEEAAREVLEFCDATGTPPPSAIIASGRGLYAKWYWSRPIGRADVGRLMGVNRALVRRFHAFGADPISTDATRILRITGSRNTGAGRMVSLLHLQQSGGHVATYDFADFARQFAPAADADAADLVLPTVADLDRAGRTRQGGRKFTREGWHWSIVEDVRTLARMRWGGVVPEGSRDVFGHVMAVQLARVFHPGNLFPEIKAHVSLILPADYAARDLVRDCSTLMNRARRAEHYRYSKPRLIDTLQITAAEERHMRALISDGEKDRREIERQRVARRAAGMAEREAWLAENATTRARPWEAENVSRATWYRQKGR